MKRIWIFLLISLLGVGLFTACASSADTMPSPSPSAAASPSVSPSASPTVTISTAPMTTAAPAADAGVNTIEDAQRVSDSLSEEIEKLSELQSAEAVVAGTIAVVGVKYDSQYQGGLTDRLTEMVQSRVETVDKSLTTVHVVDDEKTYEELTKLREQITNKDITFAQLQTKLLDLAGNMNRQDQSQQGGQEAQDSGGSGNGTGSGQQS